MTTPNGIRDEIALVGVGETEYARAFDRTGLDLIAEAMQKALDDCGLHKDEIDGLATNYGSPLSVDLDPVREVLGLNVTWYGQTSNGGSNNSTVIQWAAMALYFGMCKYVAIVFGDRGHVRIGGPIDAASPGAQPRETATPEVPRTG